MISLSSSGAPPNDGAPRLRLTDLDPRWAKDFSDGPITRVNFECPHCKATGAPQMLSVPFAPTIPDGVFQALGVPWPNPHVMGGKVWQRSGEDFSTLSLTPSLDCSACGHWHGFITNGEVT